jgi:HlyD family secretion protein
MSGRSRALGWLVVAAAAAGGGWAWLAHRGGGEDEETYRTEVVGRGPIHETVTATGTLSAVTTVQVGSQVSGIVARLHADFNSRVPRGQLLAELDPTPFQATLDQRRADLARADVGARSAEIGFLRQKRLLAEGLTSQAEYDVAQADFDAARAAVEQARAALRQAETNLTYTRILSPIDGVVVDRQYDVGQTVAASFQAPTLFTIAQDLTKMEVRADVDQADIGKIRVGQRARFTVDAYPDEEFHGEISQVRLNATVSQNVITYPVVLAVPNPGEKLRPKMTATVTVLVAREEDALRVPNAALRFRPVETAGTGGGPARGGEPGAERASGGPFQAAAAALAAGRAGPAGRRLQTVYVLESAGRLRPVSVRTGITDGRHTAIVEGELEPGDVVVVGLATAKVQGSGSFPGAQPPRGPRGMR